MIVFTATIFKFDAKGEKTGWSYIEVSSSIANQVKPGWKKTFRVKGKLDHLDIKSVALLPMGKGNFILPLNSTLRKGIGKRKGATVRVQLEEDKNPVLPDADLMTCLAEEKEARVFFNQLSPSHQKYFSKWIEAARTESTKAKRIAHTITALSQQRRFDEMLRTLKKAF